MSNCVWTRQSRRKIAEEQNNNDKLKKKPINACLPS